MGTVMLCLSHCSSPIPPFSQEAAGSVGGSQGLPLTASKGASLFRKDQASCQGAPHAHTHTNM